MLKASTALRNHILVTGSLKSALDSGLLRIYGGAIPTDGDSAIGAAVLLCTLTKNGDGTTGLTLAATASGGAVSKANEVWSGVNATSGTATFWRYVLSSDTGAASTTEKRLQGTAGTSGTELVMTSLSLAGGASTSIDYFQIALPA